MNNTDWIACADRLPEILPGKSYSDDVLAGYWYTAPDLVDTAPNKHMFVCAQVRLLSKSGETFWEKFGSQTTHWMPITPPERSTKEQAK